MGASGGGGRWALEAGVIHHGRTWEGTAEGGGLMSASAALHSDLGSLASPSFSLGRAGKRCHWTWSLGRSEQTVHPDTSFLRLRTNNCRQALESLTSGKGVPPPRSSISATAQRLWPVNKNRVRKISLFSRFLPSYSNRKWVINVYYVSVPFPAIFIFFSY